jgi:hypothetical protein
MAETGESGRIFALRGRERAAPPAITMREFRKLYLRITAEYRGLALQMEEPERCRPNGKNASVATAMNANAAGPPLQGTIRERGCRNEPSRLLPRLQSRGKSGARDDERCCPGLRQAKPVNLTAGFGQVLSISA